MSLVFVVLASVNVGLMTYWWVVIRAGRRRNCNDMKTNILFARLNEENAKTNTRTAKAIEARWDELLRGSWPPA